MALAMPFMYSCSSSSDDNEDVLEVIPPGYYVEENGDERELFSFVVNGNYVRWTCTVYGKVEEVIDYYYVIHGNKITLSSTEKNVTLDYKRNGNRVTIGEITYIKQ